MVPGCAGKDRTEDVNSGCWQTKMQRPEGHIACVKERGQRQLTHVWRRKGRVRV